MKLPFPSRVYPITDLRLSGRSHAVQACRLIEAGAKLIQLREKRLSPKEFYSETLAAIEIAHEKGVKIIINDRVDISLLAGADGVHLGQDDLPPVEARKILGPDAVIGFSTHNIDQVREARELPIDYIAFGPIFPTSTKENRDPVVGLDALKQVRQLVAHLPLVAIGGINAENLRSVLTAGADAVAAISDLYRKDGDIGARYRELINQALNTTGQADLS
jgi:thiamine-phosphate pyrophosphorylase